MSQPTVISTFAGCGGSSLGYHLAGFRELLAVEWDANAAATFRLNFPGVPLFEGDIAALSVEECLRLTGLAPGELDLFDGSPPCQGFSTTGKRVFDDPRNQLFREYCRLLAALRPKVFVMENVSGMVKGKSKIIFAEILRTLKACGYRVEVRLLNAMYFGVPQSRERLIFIGVRDDLGLPPSFPAAETAPITFREACGDLDVDGPDDRPLHRLVAAYAPHHPGGYNTDEALWAKINPGFGGHFNLKWIAWDRVCGTIARMETTVTGMVHPRRTRYLSLAELRRCGSFPDDFQFLSLADGVKRIGNAVPPQLMRAVAAHIRAEILDRLATATATDPADREAADD